MQRSDSSKTILQSAKHFFSGTLISRLTGLGREVMMAVAFGTSPSVAAFWMAFRFAYLLRRLFGEGALHSAFVPHFETLREKDPTKAARFFYDLTTGLTFLLLLIILFTEGILGGFLLFGSLSDSNQEILRLTMLMLPALVFISLYALNISLLNCERTYFLPSVAPSFLNIIWIGAIFILRNKSIDFAMEKLAMILIIAFAVQWLVTIPDVYTYLSKTLPVKWWKIKKNVGKEMLAILRPFLLGVIGVAATQVNSAFDAIFARIADPQGPAYLWYAIRIHQLPLALFGLAITGALLPPISRAVQKEDWKSYHQFLAFAYKRIVVFIIPISVAIFVLGFSGVNLVYGHGNFSQTATVQTTLSLWAYGLGLLPMTLILIFASAFYAFKDYKIPTLSCLAMVALNVILNAIFVFIFHMGAVSIALATTISSCVQVFVLGIFLYHKKGMDLNGSVSLFFKVMIASLTAGSIVLYLGSQFLGDSGLSWLLGHSLQSFPRSLPIQFKIFFEEAIVFVAIFILAAYMLSIKELFEWLPIPRKSKPLP